MNLLNDYESELLNLGANVRCILKGEKYDVNNQGHDSYFMPLSVFLKNKDKYQLESLYSRIWTLDSFSKLGKS